VKVIEVEATPLHKFVFVIGDIVGANDDWTDIVKLDGVPEQPLSKGVTVIVATCIGTPLFKVVKEGIFPDPLAARPIEVLLFVQV
jgi:hypothetical protein